MKEKSLKPRIRFKGFTEAWEQRKFGDVAVIRRGLTYSPSDIRTTGIRVLRSSNIDEEYFVKFEDDVFVNKNCINIPFVNNGDILITSANGSSRLVGKHAIIHDLKHNSAVHGGFMLLASSKNPYFLNASMSSDWYKKFIDLYVAGGNGAIGNLNKNDLDNYELMIPTNNEQIKIGELFKKLDAIITLHQRKFEKLSQIKKSLLEKMFPAEGATTPKIRFKGFTEAWEQRKVSEIYKITRGYVLAAPLTKPSIEGKYKYPVYSSQTLNDGLMGYYKDFLFNSAITWTTDGANAGTVKYRKGQFYCTNVCGVLVSDNGYANKANAEALNNIAWKYVSKVGNPKLMNNVMADIEFSTSKSIDEQQKISILLDEIDSVIALHQRK